MKMRILAVVAMLCACLGAAHAQDQSEPAIFPQLGHSQLIGWVNSVAFSPDGSILASGSLDQSIILWDMASVRELRTLSGHTDSVQSVAFSPDGSILASGSRDDTIKLWDVAGGRELRTLSGHSGDVWSVAFSPDGKMLASGSSDHTVKLWDVASGRELRTLSGHTDDVRSVAFSPDGKMLASGSDDKTIKLWDVANGGDPRTLSGHTAGVRSVAFSPDGTVLASGGQDNTLKLWGVASGQELGTGVVHRDWVNSVAFSRDGKMLASGSGDDTIKLWDMASGRALHTLTGHTYAVDSVAFSPDGKVLASGSVDNTIKLWDVASGRELRTLRGLTHWVNSVAFSPDGKVLAAGSNDATIKLWDMASGRELPALSGHAYDVEHVAFSPDGKVLAAGSLDGVKLWDMVNGGDPRTLSGAGPAVAFSPDGAVLASGGADITLWDAASARQLRTLSGQTRGGGAVAFSPDGKTLASGGEDRTIILWDVASGRQLRTLSSEHLDSVTSLAFSPDGKALASGSDLSGGRETTLILWDLASGRELWTLSGHPSVVSSVAFSPDGKALASGSWDNTIKLWDVASGRQLRAPLSGHLGFVDSVAFSPGGKTLASGSKDGTIRVWDIASGKERVGLVDFDDGSALAFTPEGYFDDSSATAEEYLNVRCGNRVYAIGSYRDKFYKPELVKLSLAGTPLSPLGFAGISCKEQPPKVELLDLPQSTNESTVSVKVRIADQGGGIGAVMLYRNGGSIPAPPAVADTGPMTRSITYNVQLAPGRNILRVAAWNAAGLQQSSEDAPQSYDPCDFKNLLEDKPSFLACIQANFTPPEPSTPEPMGTLYAVVIGINDFPKSNGDFPHLKYAEGDAKLIADTLATYYKGVYKNVEIKLLNTEDETSKSYVENTLQSLQKEVTAAEAKDSGAGDRDTLVFFASSHGAFTDDEYYLMPSDVASDGTGAFKQDTAIIEGDLIKWIRNIPMHNKLVLLDTCHAQLSGDPSKIAVQTGGKDDWAFVRNLSKDMGWTVLGAATSDEEAYEDFNNHGFFSSAVNQGLSTQNGLLNGTTIVTNVTLEAFVLQDVPRIASNHVPPLTQEPAAARFGPYFDLTKPP